MRLLKTAILLGAFAVYAGTGLVRANQQDAPGSGDPFEMWFDENGNAFASVNGGPLVPLAHGTELEPSSGINNALFYVLPETVVPGDVRVWEDQNHTVLSDVLRFTTTKLYYFSDNSDAGDTDLADTGLPGDFSSNVSDVVEVGPEGDNHFDWFPIGNIFHGVSDGTLNLPDAGPGFALSAIAILFPLFVRRFRP